MSNRYVGGVITEKVNVAQAPWSGAWTEQAQLQAKAQGTWAPLNTQIGNSLRFRSSASAYLSRTPAAASNRMTWTWSGWVKRGALGSDVTLFCTSTNGTTFFEFTYGASGTIFQIDQYNGTARDLLYQTTAVYRDPSAWYHVVVAIDTTQAISTDRVKLWVNGVQVTSWQTATAPSQNLATYVNATNAHVLGRRNTSSPSQYFDGYLAEVNFVDGQALTPAAFGMFDAASGVWKPTVYGGTYGTNGFKLNFSNGTSTTTLGYDSSGNSNNWTTNNISLTAGTTYDWMLDSPTPLVGTSYGVGNYAVLNPLPGLNASSSLSNGNLKILLGGTSGGNANGVLTTFKNNSGKWYAEFTIDAVSNGNTYPFIGITGASTLSASNVTSNAASYAIRANGNIDALAVFNTAYGTSFSVNDICNIALDYDSGKIWYGKNGTWFASGNPSNGTNPSSSGISSSTLWSFAVSGDGNASVSINFGQRPFSYSPPTGFKTLCTFNLPAPAIANGANYMAATTYTGNGSTQNIVNTVNGVSFQPDFVWTKGRSAAEYNSLYDVIRGVNKRLFSNTTDAEGTAITMTAFNTNGFAVSTNSGAYTATNASGTTFVGWQWKAGGTAVTNTNGSITSSVSASALSGFSVVTYTGTGANATVGHGLGVAPSMVIVKNRTNAAYNWAVYSQAVGATQWLQLNTTSAVITASNVWNNTAPTSSVFSIGTASTVNDTTTFVAYCFAAIAGYSAFGSYTGNGSADGPFVYCGFRPRFVLTKRTAAAGNWQISDTSRTPSNVVGQFLQANLSSAEATATEYDILSNGFKLRSTDGDFNTSGETFIYAAFAENPFQNALAR